MKKKFDKVTIIGPGLIGASLGLALKKKKVSKHILGIDKSMPNLANAIKIGAIDEKSRVINRNVSGSDIIFLCTPVSQIELLVKKIVPFVTKKTIISDVGSVKNIFRDTTLKLLKKYCKIVPAHPVAGTENSGAKNAIENLFVNKWCILTPEKKNCEEVKIISQIWKRIGMKISIMSADDHDKIMSITSHLPHLIAFTIVGTAFNLNVKKKKDLLNFSAGGFKDFTRIGSSDPKMWSDIFLKNKKYILKTLNDFNKDLNFLKELILNMDEKEIIKLLKRTKNIRREILTVESNIKKKN